VSYRVKEVAAMAGVSVRTLHHYDQIGLLKPESVSDAGYRLYSDRDLARLQQILFFKELGFSLRQTKAIIDNPGFDRVQALKAHRKMLIEQRNRLDRLVETVERTIESVEEGTKMSAKEIFQGFDMAEIEAQRKKYAKEVEERWGGSEAYEESKRRASAYTADDWARLTKRSAEIYEEFINLMDRSPEDPAVQEVVEKWRQYITESFYNCTPEILRGLGEMYVSDSRFTENIDKAKPGLAQFMSEAIRVYCDKALGAD
jgi:DNA-binding transcriptional MerR regulator